MVTFKYWIGGVFQLIQLSERLAVEFHEGGPTDEGFSFTCYKFTLEPGLVRLEVSTEARDCDGRIEVYNEYTCPIDKLESVLSPLDATRIPEWECVDCSQRDYSAEAAGY